MNYQPFINAQGERIWLPILAGAAIITAPFWLGRNCCGNNNQGYQPYPYYQQPYPYPVPYPVYYPPQYNYSYPTTSTTINAY